MDNRSSPEQQIVRKRSQKEGKMRVIFFLSSETNPLIEIYEEYKGVIMKKRPILLQLTKQRRQLPKKSRDKVNDKII